MPFSLPRLLPALGLGLLLAQGAQAEDRFDVSLGGNHLGRITHARSGDTRDLTLLLDSTPFGVFDGSYSARTVRSGQVLGHSGRTRSSRKSRDLTMQIAAGQPRSVVLSPAAERTALTDPTAVTGPVRDPVSAFGDLMEANSCPDGLRVYDGRRVGLLTLESKEREGNRITCNIAYRVIEGPGYLEPLGISRLSVRVDYNIAGPKWQLMRVGARSGPFGLALDRETTG